MVMFTQLFGWPVHGCRSYPKNVQHKYLENWTGFQIVLGAISTDAVRI